MEVAIISEIGIGEQMFVFLERNPQNYDVVFSVGEEKTIVKAVKFVLKAASPVFEREFVNHWENAVIKEGEGIPLSEFDPTVFQLFIKLLIQDKWSVAHLKSMYLSEDILLQLLRICQHFEITKAIPNLKRAASELIWTIKQYEDSDEFLLMPRENLETILSFEELPLNELEIFLAACKWAENKCKQSQLEPTAENMRNALGGCFQEIRFPVMTFKQFAKACRVKKLMTVEEREIAFDFIGLEDDEKGTYDTSQVPFKTEVRQAACITLDFKKLYPNAETTRTICDGAETQINKKILLRGVGFFGPTDEDSYFEVAVQVQWKVNYEVVDHSKTYNRKLYARKGKVFYFFFDQPVVINSSAGWDTKNYYSILYGLKGPSATMFKGSLKDNKFQIEQNEFRIPSYTNSKYICELIFQEI